MNVMTITNNKLEMPKISILLSLPQYSYVYIELPLRKLANLLSIRTFFYSRIVSIHDDDVHLRPR